MTRVPRFLVAGLALVIVLPGSPVILADEAPSRQPDRSARPRSSRAISLPAGPAQLARVQVVGYRLTCPASTLAKLDLTKLPGASPTGTPATDYLSTLGEADLAARIDTVIDLQDQARISFGSRVPVVQDITVSKDGRSTPAITYEECGGRLTLDGQWLGDEPAKARVDVDLEFSLIVPSAVALPANSAPSDTVVLPTMVQFSLEGGLTLLADVPHWTVSNSAPMPDDPQGRVHVILAQITLHPLPGPAVDAGPVNGNYAVRGEVYELRCPVSRLHTLRLDDWALADETSESLLERLGQLGQAKLLHRVNAVGSAGQEVEVKAEQRVPSVTSINVDKQGKAVPSVSYEDVGMLLRMVGRWRAGEPAWAINRSRWEVSTIGQSPLTVHTGVTLPTFDELRLSRSLALTSGSTSWSLIGYVPTVGTDQDTATVLLTGLRLDPSPDTP